MNNYSRNIVLLIFVCCFVLLVFKMFSGPRQESSFISVPYSEFLADIQRGQVKEVKIKGPHLSGVLEDGRLFSSYAPNDPQLIQRLSDKNIRFVVEPPESEGHGFLNIFLSWLPMIMIVAVWIYIFRQMQSGSNRAMGFGKSRARLLSEKSGKVTFNEVAGVEEAKEEVKEIVDFLKDPQKFQKLGGRIPKGVLLIGPPGTGKTLLARAIAGEANVPFFTISGSDFVEMFVGVGASRVRDLFEQGKKNAPCIIFIDEIDAVGRHRGVGLGGGNDEREQTLNQLLVEMDGFEANEGVILIAATNRPDVLDPALLRPGRFDRQVMVALPDIKGREAILKVHTTKVSIGGDVDPYVLARGTPGFSGADLANLVNEAALIAARQNKRLVMMTDFEEAKDKVLMGPERRTIMMSEEEKRLTAYHEAGHALVGYYNPYSDPIHKATIIPRGRALGMVVRLPENDRVSMARARLKADLEVSMGGRIAEEIIFGPDKVTTGASSDIRQATDIARKMVTEWGMSEKLGPLRYVSGGPDAYGSGYSSGSTISEATAKIIDEETKIIVEEAYKSAQQIIKKNLDKLNNLATALLEFETLSGDEISSILNDKVIEREKNKPVKSQAPKSTLGRRRSSPSSPKEGESSGGDVKI